MTSETPDPTTRFSNRVTDYTRSRPSYPAALITLLESEVGLAPGRTVADVGSGTGILTGLLLETGCRVIGVEPNDEMRGAAEARLGGHPEYQSVPGTAEDTGIAENSVDVVTAAQAFHWFDVKKSSQEFRRILRQKGWVVLVWNRLRAEDNQFSGGYERFLEEWGRGYTEVRASWDVEASLAELFGEGPVERGLFPNPRPLDFEGLRSRFLSSSYAPSRDDPQVPAAAAALRRLFDRHALDGTVTMAYDTKVYYGRLDER